MEKKPFIIISRFQKAFLNGQFLYVRPHDLDDTVNKIAFGIWQMTNGETDRKRMRPAIAQSVLKIDG